MYRNYFIIALRNIRRNLSYAFLNVFGLTLGIASCLVIFLIVRNELNYDSFGHKADRTYRVTLHAIDYNSNVSTAIVPTMRVDFPELEQVTQVFYQHEGLIKVGQSIYKEKNYAFADKYLPSVFDYQWIVGDPKTALAEPNTIVLTETMAKKYFGQQNAMGQVINLEKQYNLKVTGVIKDIPGNTSLPFNFLVSLETIRKDLSNFFWSIPGGSYAFIVLPQNLAVSRIESKIPAFIKKNWGADIAKAAKLPLQPLKDIHFDQRYINNIVTPTSKETYWVLAGVALLIIVTACINFINLATAQAIKRAKEVGVRKVLGANREQLIGQFLGETTVLVLLAVFMGVVIAAIFLTQADKWLDIKIGAEQLGEGGVIAWIVVLTVVVILLSGLYPAFVQSAFQPVESLKSKAGISLKGLTLRKSLVVAQFAISQILIVGTIIVAHQMDYFKNKDLGFNKDAIISVGIPDQAKRDVLQQQLTADPGVKDISFSSGAPAYNNSFTSLSAKELGLTKDDVTEVKFIDERYTDMFGLKMLAGNKITKDTLHHVVVNETLMHKLGIRNPQAAIGKKVTLNGNYDAYITGIVQDFQSESKHKQRRACVLMYNPKIFFTASIRIQPAAMHQTIDHIGKIWSAQFHDNVFEYEFLDEHIASLYKQEQKAYTAFGLFSSIAILIGCLGLYGLIAFAASQRTKEVGIRKVLGAPIMSIVGLFTKEFVWLILIAFFIAAPIGYFMMDKWLQNFAYHVNIGATTFLIAIAASFIIALITILQQVIKAALANPVKSLRSE
ncbi:MAG: FtsX-like permease family protein [Mucilaginibacter sp.]|nr:FtsX-like permease family protein [Mucilaginibacter sp.]